MQIPSQKLKVLIVDDMLTYRAILTQVLKEFEWVEITGTASNGQSAIEAMHKKTADLVLIDLEMPVMNGLQAVPLLRQQFPKAQVVLISGTNKNSADLTLQALEAGAMDFIPKPNQSSLSANMEELRQKLRSVTMTCLEKIKCQEQLKNRTLPPTRTSRESGKAIAYTSTRISASTGFDVVAIGVSTGGPNALSELIPALPENLGVPILIVQHMPPLFTASLANMLDKKSALRVKEAEQNELVLPNIVYIAPGGRHMKIGQANSAKKTQILLEDTPPINSCRPAVDVLFQSLPSIYGKSVLSVILTGMGSDGAVGVRQIKEKGGYCLTQSADSCVVYGMPRSVDELGLSDEQIPLSELSTRIQQLIKATKKDRAYVSP
jgi:two-component system, chemotaxis family, protein-glutamate methylesterase/glutaminase